MDNTTPHLSDEYDKQVLKTIPYYQAIHQETINLVRIIKPGCRFWMDTGCGTGSLVDQAYEVFPEAEFYVCDPFASLCWARPKNGSPANPGLLF